MDACDKCLDQDDFCTRCNITVTEKDETSNRVGKVVRESGDMVSVVWKDEWSFGVWYFKENLNIYEYERELKE